MISRLNFSIKLIRDGYAMCCNMEATDIFKIDAKSDAKGHQLFFAIKSNCDNQKIDDWRIEALLTPRDDKYGPVKIDQDATCPITIAFAGSVHVRLIFRKMSIQDDEPDLILKPYYFELGSVSVFFDLHYQNSNLIRTGF